MNGNADPSLLEFLRYWDFDDDLSSKVGTAFATGGGATAGLEPTVAALHRSLLTFRMVVVGGATWETAEGAAGVQDDADWNATLVAARAQGSRAAQVAAALAPPKSNSSQPPPPSFGEQWTALVSANMTQAGYDAGEVDVNFTAACEARRRLFQRRRLDARRGM